MIFENTDTLKTRITSITGRRHVPTPRVFENTSNMFAISSGDVLRLGGNDYYVLGEAHEGRFGLDDEPKHWVKYAWDLTSGKNKIIKLEVDEAFSTRIGRLLIKAKRSAEKEARFIAAAKGHPNFMQGFSVRDVAGNLVRVIDEIRGDSLFNYVLDMHIDHESYYSAIYPNILRHLIECIEGLNQVCTEGLHHGDIRNDHIFIESTSGVYKWIDFDYTVTHSDYDLWSIGNLIVFTVAGGLLLYKDVTVNRSKFPLVRGEVSPDDCSFYHKYRIANVKKVYPYVSDKINNICLRYTVGHFNLYSSYDEILDDLREAAAAINA